MRSSQYLRAELMPHSSFPPALCHPLVSPGTGRDCPCTSSQHTCQDSPSTPDSTGRNHSFVFLVYSHFLQLSCCHGCPLLGPSLRGFCTTAVIQTKKSQQNPANLIQAGQVPKHPNRELRNLTLELCF